MNSLSINNKINLDNDNLIILNASDELFEILSDSEDISTLKYLALHPLIPNHVALKLAKHSSITVRDRLANNKNLKFIDVLTQLSYDHEESVLRSLVINKNTPAEILDRLAREGTVMHFWFLNNPNVSEETLVFLMEQKENKRLIPDILKHPNCSRNVIETKLA